VGEVSRQDLAGSSVYDLGFLCGIRQIQVLVVNNLEMQKDEYSSSCCVHVWTGGNKVQ